MLPPRYHGASQCYRRGGIKVYDAYMVPLASAYQLCVAVAVMLQVAGLDISEKDIDELITRLDLDGDGQIDYGLVADTVGVQVDKHGE
jgi:hypothetical protein